MCVGEETHLCIYAQESHVPGILPCYCRLGGGGGGGGGGGLLNTYSP